MAERTQFKRPIGLAVDTTLSTKRYARPMQVARVTVCCNYSQDKVCGPDAKFLTTVNSSKSYTISIMPL